MSTNGESMKILKKAVVIALAALASSTVLAQGQGVAQTEKEFQQLLPITGTMRTKSNKHHNKSKAI